MCSIVPIGRGRWPPSQPASGARRSPRSCLRGTTWSMQPQSRSFLPTILSLGNSPVCTSPYTAGQSSTSLDRNQHMSIPEQYAYACSRLARLLSRSSIRTRIVELLVQGKSRKAIASALNRSPHTIDAHIKQLYRGVGVYDRAQLIVVAVLLFRFGISSPPPNFG